MSYNSSRMYIVYIYYSAHNNFYIIFNFISNQFNSVQLNMLPVFFLFFSSIGIACYSAFLHRWHFWFFFFFDLSALFDDFVRAFIGVFWFSVNGIIIFFNVLNGLFLFISLSISSLIQFKNICTCTSIGGMKKNFKVFNMVMGKEVVFLF